MTVETAEFQLDRFLAEERGRVDEALDRALDRLTPLLPSALRGPVEHGVREGGKRLRPILCVAAYRAAQGAGAGGAAAGLIGSVPRAAYDLSVSVELIHAYSLMHDDLPCMDDAPLRRGRPTPHTIHGERATIVGAAALIPGAALQTWWAALDLGLGADGARSLVRILAGAAGGAGMVGGQALDLLGEGNGDLTREEVDQLHGRKTGALLAASLEMGSTAAGAGPEVRDALGRYGREIGLAFQIWDDVLDATADAETLGKHPSDHDLGKSTYVALLGVGGARAEAETLADAALASLAEVGISSAPLEALARYVVQRES